MSEEKNIEGSDKTSEVEVKVKVKQDSRSLPR